MNKRKLMLVAVVLCMAAILLAGGTLAYLTDTDQQTNTFTVGDIGIELEEKFPENELMPGPNNALTKEVTVKNTGSNPAYLWIELLVPEILDTPEDASQNDLHFNPYDTYATPDGDVPMKGSEAKAAGYKLVAETVETYMGKVTIDNITYNVYREHIKDAEPVENNGSSYAMLAQVYMDAAINHCHDANCECEGAGYILKDGTCYTGEWEIIVRAYGIQSQGFNSIDEAMAAYYAQEPSDATK